MNTQDTTRETLASNEELALRLAELELRVAVHDEILNFLKTILDQLKESGYRLVADGRTARRVESVAGRV